ncbi:hypothetical protein GCM10023116_20260 [Kistimonas scapharcae]|uniref:Uncharacterized protein n=1 Tax=Kistimonas scapharcae TaxID=1036133 RepID=A0ABP8V3D0_9GAMM
MAVVQEGTYRDLPTLVQEPPEVALGLMVVLGVQKQDIAVGGQLVVV